MVFIDMMQIIYAILDNHGVDKQLKDADDGWEKHHNWVDEVSRCETRVGPILLNDVSRNSMIIQLLPQTKDFNMLTR